MSEDWAAVAKALNDRVDELGWLQRELARRSNVSQAIIREIQHHVVERRRSPRTLESLSTALGWHPGHLEAVLHGIEPPSPDDPLSAAALSSRLERMEQHLIDIAERLDGIDSAVTTVIDQTKPTR